MKILISAFSFAPSKGSEPGIGWNWARLASAHHEVWVLTSTRHEAEVKAWVQQHQEDPIHIVFHDLPWWPKSWRTGIVRNHAFYRAWQYTAHRRALNLHDRWGFDLGHHVTYGQFRHPSFLARMPFPFIWGPVAGGEAVPLRLWSSIGPKGIARETLKVLSAKLIWLDPTVRRTAAQAARILTATPQTASHLPAPFQNKTMVVPAMGLDPNTFPFAIRENVEAKSLRLLFVGNLLYWKGPQLAIMGLAQALKQSPVLNLSLTFIGRGSYRKHLESLANDLGIADRVSFVGFVEREQLAYLYHAYDAFLFPSLTDSGGFVVLEAMATGLPVICLALAGPGLATQEGAGIRVKPGTTVQITQNIADAIIALAESPLLRRDIAFSGRRRLEKEYDWTARVSVVDTLYADVMADQGA